MPKQLSHEQVEALAEQAARKSFGFEDPDAHPDVLKVARRAAFHALELAGCLDKQRRVDRAWNDQQVARDKARHAAICNAAGLKR